MSSFELRHDAKSVEIWTDTRLPFQPRGGMLEARSALKQAISSLKPSSHQMLLAEYMSCDRDFFDLENVLFYNVGSGPFARVAQNGLHGKSQRCSPPASPSGRPFRHYQRYGFENFSDAPQLPNVALSFRVQPLTTATKVHQVWWAASVGLAQDADAIPGRFALCVEVPPITCNIAAIIKQLLDGVISAMHPANTVDVTAAQRLAAATAWGIDSIITRLRSPSLPLLAPRQVLRTYRQFVKWDPADELCDEFLVVPSSMDGLCHVRIAPLDDFCG